MLVISKEGLAHSEEDIWVSLSLAGRDGDASVQAVADGENPISLRNYNGQLGEVVSYVSTINKLNPMDLPVRKPQV